jgi:hypothetical protein
MMAMMGTMMSCMGKAKGKGGKSWGDSGAQTSEASVEELKSKWDPFAALNKHGVSYNANSSKSSSDAMPEIVMLQVNVNSPQVQQGYPPDVVAMEFDKRVGLYSESHYVLQSLLSENGMHNGYCSYDHDPEGTTYPEISQAWKAAGKEDNLPTVALIPDLKIWGVGFGGRVNALRAAKLSLSISLAGLVDPKRLQSTAEAHPEFGQMLAAMIAHANQAAEAMAQAAVQPA